MSLSFVCTAGAPGTWQKHYVWMETITRSAQHLMGIINDIITVRAARSGMHLKQELVRFTRLMAQALRRCRCAVAEQAACQVSPGGDGACIVRGVP